MMESHTKRKFLEANFFLNQVEASLGQFDNRETEYFLSAFVSAARSATFVMQKEYSVKADFKEWWSAYDRPALFRKFNDLRVVLLHLRAPKVPRRIQLNFGAGGFSLGAKETAEFPLNLTGGVESISVGNVERPDGSQYNREANQIIDLVVEEFYEREGREIKFDSFLVESKQYLALLATIVEECETKFGSNIL